VLGDRGDKEARWQSSKKRRTRLSSSAGNHALRAARLNAHDPPMNILERLTDALGRSYREERDIGATARLQHPQISPLADRG